MGTNITGRDPGSCGGRQIIVDRDLQKAAEWRPQGDRGGGTSLSGEYITGRAAAPCLEILPPPEDMWQFRDMEILWSS